MGALFPKGYYRVRIKALSVLGNSDQDAPEDRVVWLNRMEILEPKEHAGMLHFERYYIGTKEDPKAELGVTLRNSMGARSLKTMLNRARVPLSNDDEATCAKAVEAELIVYMVEGKTKDGTPINNCRGYYELGSPEHAKVGQPLSPTLGTGPMSPPVLSTSQGGAASGFPPWANRGE